MILQASAFIPSLCVCLCVLAYVYVLKWVCIKVYMCVEARVMSDVPLSHSLYAEACKVSHLNHWLR